MRAICMLLLLASAATCQAQHPPAKAAKTAAAAPGATPARAERALRARVNAFFQAHMDQKYRLAEQYIARDSRDYFYALQKTPYLEFAITKITFSDHFTKASVIVNGKRDVKTQAGELKVTVPEQTTWKLERGLWCWYVDQSVMKTPFGDRPQSGSVAQAPLPEKPVVKPKMVDLRQTWFIVSPDKKEIHLPPGGGTEILMLRNFTPRAVGVKIEPPATPGLEVKSQRERIGSNYQSRVTFTYAPQPNSPAPASTTVNILVEPEKRTIPIKVSFDGPAAKK